MPEDDVAPVAEAPLDPEEVSDRSFPTAFRGFDPVEVRAFLGQVADELRRLHELEAELRRTVDGREPRPAEAEASDVVRAAQAEAAALTEAAQAEAEQILREAKERVATLGSAATQEVSRVLDEARAEAVRIRARATDSLKAQVEEVQTTAVKKIAEAEREAASIRVKAREEADEIVEAARERGRDMVAEAQAARERMLADLAKRKRAAQSQLEQLRVGRDRLLDTLKVARRSIDEMTTRFDGSEGGGPAAAPPAVTSFTGQPAPTGPTVAAASPSGPVPPPIAAAPAAPAPPLEQQPSASPSGRPRAATPARTRAVAIGEPPTSTTRARIAAPRARPDAGHETGPAHKVDAPVALATEPAIEAPVEQEAPAPPAAPPRSEERRSSALRILRRHRTPPSAPVPPLIGRDSPAEGVRIIASAPTAPESENAGEASVGDDPGDAPSTDDQSIEETSVEDSTVEDQQVAEGDPEAEPDEVEDVAAPEPDPAIISELAADPESEPDAKPVAEPDAEPLLPLAREEIRPKIEDLFARLRADREAAVERAKNVLAPSDDPATPALPAPVVAADELDSPPPEVTEVPIAPVADEDERLLEGRDAITEPLIGQLTKRLKRALQDEQNTSLDRLRTSRGPVHADSILAGRDDQAAPYRHLALAFLDEAARFGAAASPFGPIAVGVDDLAAELANELAGALRTRLDQVLRSGGEEEVDLATLGERISSAYREWKVQKVERLATHYLMAAHQRGGFLAQPEGAPLRWLVDDDGPCPDCEDNALAGPTPRGERFPTGQLHPPAHVGCRCLLAPAPT